MALVEVEVVMKIDVIYFRAIIMSDRVTSVATAGLQVVVLNVKVQVLTMKVVVTLKMTSLE